MRAEETVILAPTLDALITEREHAGNHLEGESCEYRLSKGQPLSKKKCSMCERLSALIDLSVSWKQKIDSGRLTGRSVEIVPMIGARSVRDAEATWKLYRECDNAQRVAKQSLVRRYYASFTCGGEHYALRDVATLTNPPSLHTMIDQLLELFETAGALPPHFIHGNPTVTSISFLGRLPVALRHYPSRGKSPYFSRSLLQVDFGGADSAALTSAAAFLASRQKSVSSVVVGDEPLGAIIMDPERKVLTVRAEASFVSFLREYPRHAKLIALYLLTRGLLSLYTEDEVLEYREIVPQGGSSSKNLREAFEQLRGTSIPLDLPTKLADSYKRLLA